MSFQLSDYIPEDNFYRRLKDILSLEFLYKATSKYYGQEGQKSIDPIVFFKLLLVGYLENQPSDRRIINTASMRLDVRYFIGYDLDEELPWHSTLSRTRQLYDEDVFNTIFKQVLTQCIKKGMLSGRRQAVDSVLVKANASMDSIREKEIIDDLSLFTKELKDSDIESKPNTKESNHRKNSNKNRSSSTDPDARMATKPGKPTKLNYLAQLSVDSPSYVITHIEAFHADKKDSQCLESVIEKAWDNLADHDLYIEEVIADTNYSSSETLKALEKRNIKGFIPNTGTYKPEREGFVFDSQNNNYLCKAGKVLEFKGYRKHHSIDKVYRSSYLDCKNCPFKSNCLGKSKQKTITNSLSKPLFDQMHQRINSSEGKKMMSVRKSTVEPIIGTLVEYLGMKKVYTKGIKLANKCMLLAGTCYNLKKLLKHVAKKTIITTIQVKSSISYVVLLHKFTLTKLKTNVSPVLIAY